MNRRARSTPPTVTVLTLLYTLLAFCAVCVMISLIARMRDRILPGPLMEVLESLALVYATPVTIAVAGVLPHDKRHAPVRYPRAAIVLLVMWNLILLIPFVVFLGNQDMQTNDVTQFCNAVTKNWTFLISGVLAFTSTTERNGGK